MLSPARTDAEAQANLAELVRTTRARLGLPANGIVPVERQGEYFRALSAAILANPAAYPPTSVENARRNQNAPDQSPITSYGVRDALADFGSGLADQAARIGGAAASIGQGVIASANLMRWLLPIAIVAAVALFLWRRVGAPSPSK
jgi:hypothetical protein